MFTFDLVAIYREQPSGPLTERTRIVCSAGKIWGEIKSGSSRNLVCLFLFFFFTLPFVSELTAYTNTPPPLDALTGNMVARDRYRRRRAGGGII